MKNNSFTSYISSCFSDFATVRLFVKLISAGFSFRGGNKREWVFRVRPNRQLIWPGKFIMEGAGVRFWHTRSLIMLTAGWFFFFDSRTSDFEMPRLFHVVVLALVRNRFEIVLLVWSSLFADGLRICLLYPRRIFNPGCANNIVNFPNPGPHITLGVRGEETRGGDGI